MGQVISFEGLHGSFGEPSRKRDDPGYSQGTHPKDDSEPMEPLAGESVPDSGPYPKFPSAPAPDVRMPTVRGHIDAHGDPQTEPNELQNQSGGYGYDIDDKKVNI